MWDCEKLRGAKSHWMPRVPRGTENAELAPISYMPATSEVASPPAPVEEPAFGGMEERRKRMRVRLKLPVRFHPGKDLAPIESTTCDISSEGFFCLTPRAFAPGESVACSISWPAHAPDGFDKPFIIQCEVRVVRCEHDTSSGMFGTACHIEEYRCNHPERAVTAKA